MINNPPLTIEQFDEKTKKLDEVYQNNQQNTFMEFMKKQEAIFNRLSEADKKFVIDRERAKVQAAASRLIGTNDGLVDAHGRKITTH